MTVVTLDQLLEDIINSPVEPEDEGLLEKIDKTKDMLLIKSRFYRIGEEYQELLSEKKDYRKLVRVYLGLNPSYEYFGECFEEAREILFMVEDGPIEMNDVFGLIRKIKGFRFKIKPKPGELYSFTKETVRTFLEKCKSRDEFYTRLDELEELVDVYGLGTDFRTDFFIQFEVKRTYVVIGFDTSKDEDNWKDFEERCLKEKQRIDAIFDRYEELSQFYL